MQQELSERELSERELSERELSEREELLKQEQLSEQDKYKNRRNVNGKVNAAAVMELCYEMIANGKAEDFHLLASLLPIDKAKPKTGDKILRKFLIIAIKYGQSDMIREIFLEWERVYPVIQNPEFQIIMFAMPMMEDYIIREISREYLITYREVITELMSYEDSELTSFACYRADRIFKIQDKQENLEMFKRLYERASTKNESVSFYLIDHINNSSPYAPKPKYIKDSQLKVEDIRIETKIDDLTVPLSEEEAYELMMASIKQKGYTEEKINKSISLFRERYEAMTNQEKIDFVQSSYKDREKVRRLQRDKTIFRLLGPVNAMFGASGDELNYGGERMLLSRARDYLDDEGRYVDWFTGNCDECHLKIRKRWYAVRKPILTGGWFGCFCSWKCCRKQVARETEPSIQLKLVDNAAILTESIGILDRISDPNEPRNIIKDSFLPLETVPPLK